ncbi:hypothetical protein KSF78_0005751 [Schistosoma japonicum]|nr:hypothetical protein KSF78_0005751 [Schistosoma japonicum]
MPKNLSRIDPLHTSMTESILIEYCLAKDELLSSKKLSINEYENRLYLKCLNTNIHRIKQMISIFNSLSGYQCIVFQQSLQNQIQGSNQSIWISQPFNLRSNTSLIKSVYFTCLIRVCQMEQFCTYANFNAWDETDEQHKNYSIQSKVSVPLILLNNHIETKLFQLFPPKNLNKLIQFYFIQSTIELTNQTIIDKQLNNPTDKFYVKCKHGDHRNSFIIAMSTNKVRRSLIRNTNSEHKNHNDNTNEDTDEIHNIHILNDKQDNSLNKEITNIECCTIKQNRCHHYPQYNYSNHLNITTKPQQTKQSMAYLLLYPFNKLDNHLLFNGNNTINYTNSCLSSSNPLQHHSLSHFITDSYVKSHKVNLSQSIGETELNIEHNQMKTPIEQSAQKEYDEKIQIDNVNDSLINKSKQEDIFFSINYHDDYIKQQHGHCTVYHNLKNQEYKDGWV